MAKMELTSKERKKLIRIIVAFSLFLIIFVLDKCFSLSTLTGGKFGWLTAFVPYFAVYILIGYDVLRKAFRNIFSGQFFDENFLMCIATSGAISLGIYLGVNGKEAEGFDEACAVLLFYQVGEFFQSYATGKTRKSISSLMDIRPDCAHVRRDGEILTVMPEEVSVGETIIVKPGERVPLDGIVTSGGTTLDTKALTGESMPREVVAGDAVLSGTVNLTSQIEICVGKEFHDSTVSVILDLVENASAQKSKAENFITKFARYYTPTVVVLAVCLAVIPSLVTSQWSLWIYRALSFLVVSCPCALVISVPLSFFTGIGSASGNGILIKGSSYLERLSKSNIFVFDKTGTLTKGNFNVTDVRPNASRKEILRLAATCEQGSDHPIARSILSEYGGAVENDYEISVSAGCGVIAKRREETVLCGNEKIMNEYGIRFIPHDGAGTVVYVARNGEFVGSILISDEIKPETEEVIRKLNAMNVKTVMLTGDNETVARNVAEKIGIEEYKSSLLPMDKTKEVEKMINDKSDNDVLCFVGDGINDAPVLMRSDVGIAMGGIGSDAAIEASDVVLMKDDLNGILQAKGIAKKTMRTVRQNIWFSLLVKGAILVLSALGITNMWIAVFGDVGVAVIAILNAMRVNSSCGKNK